MDKEMLAESVAYELLTQRVYQEILARKGSRNLEVKHNVDVEGASGVKHQVDVLWRLKYAGIEHLVIIECKNYAANLTLEKVRNLFAVAHDLGATALMVTKTGYQAGAAAFAKHYKLNLKLLRAPVESDFEGRINQIQVNMTAKMALSTEQFPMQVGLHFESADAAQAARVDAWQSKAVALFGDPREPFLDAAGAPITDGFGLWLPQKLPTLDMPAGGPYTEKIELQGHYLRRDLGQGGELVKVKEVVVSYYVSEVETEQISLHARDVVEAVLSDFESGEVEHFTAKP